MPKQKLREVDIIILAALRELRIGQVESEYRFEQTRRWKFDYCIQSAKLAVEIEGAIWTNGRHTRGSGFLRDCEKYAEATAQGWTLFRFATDMIRNGSAAEYLRKWKRESFSAWRAIAT